MVVLTDGRSTEPTATRRAVIQAKETGIHVISVGPAAPVDGQAELLALASDPHSVITVDDFDALLSSLGNVTNAFCRCKSVSLDVQL